MRIAYEGKISANEKALVRDTEAAMVAANNAAALFCNAFLELREALDALKQLSEEKRG